MSEQSETEAATRTVAAPKKNTVGIISLIFGILSIFVFAPLFVPLAVLFGVIALFMGQIAFAIAGLICAVIGFGTSPILLGLLGAIGIGVAAS